MANIAVTAYVDEKNTEPILKESQVALSQTNLRGPRTIKAIKKALNASE